MSAGNAESHDTPYPHHSERRPGGGHRVRHRLPAPPRHPVGRPGHRAAPEVDRAPAARARPRPRRGVVPPFAHSPAGYRPAGVMRILVIEDEPRILGFLRSGLEAEGFAVDGASDGATGLSLALAEAYELIVLDLQLPRLDGLRLL